MCIKLVLNYTSLYVVVEVSILVADLVEVNLKEGIGLAYLIICSVFDC
jgi:hypothetical protein